MTARGRRFTFLHTGLFILAVTSSCTVMDLRSPVSHSSPPPSFPPKGGDGFARAETPSVVKSKETPNTPTAFRARGRLVCLAEEMKERFGAEVQPVHDHILGFRLEKSSPAGLRYPLILRTAQSEALYVDERFKKHTLILSGRVFPGTGILEVSGWQWHRDGKSYEVYYWCDVCTIRGFTPGSCACCQAEVELRERVIPAPGEE